MSDNKAIVGEWISVEEKDKLPQDGKRVLVVTHTGSMDVGYLLHNHWERNWAGTSFKEAGYEITHWMPLPNPPKTT